MNFILIPDLFERYLAYQGIYISVDQSSKQIEFLIRSKSDFLNMLSQLNSLTEPALVYICLASDIDLAGENVQPVKNNNIMGVFDANYHTISNLTISSTQDAALFDAVNGWVFKNLRLQSPKVQTVGARAALFSVRMANSVISNVQIQDPIVVSTANSALLACEVSNSRVYNLSGIIYTALQPVDSSGFLFAVVSENVLIQSVHLKLSANEATNAQNVIGMTVSELNPPIVRYMVKEYI